MADTEKPPNASPTTSNPSNGAQQTSQKGTQFYPPPTSSYYFGPPSSTQAFGEAVTGNPRIHLPKEIVRVERDYSSGELPQFHSSFPLELEGRITPTAFSEIINDLNSHLISAHNPTRTWIDNTTAILTFYLSSLCFGTHYQRRMKELTAWVDRVNKEQFEPVGLRMRHPSRTAMMFVEIEYF